VEHNKENKKSYKLIEKNKGSNKLKKPFFCPHCKKITGSIDDEKLLSLGICAECFVLYVDLREKPLIDLDYYKKLKEDGGH